MDTLYQLLTRFNDEFAYSEKRLRKASDLYIPSWLSFFLLFPLKPACESNQLNQYDMPEAPVVLHRMEQELANLSASGSDFTGKNLWTLLQLTSLTKAIAQDTAVQESSLGRSFFQRAERWMSPFPASKRWNIRFLN